MCRHIRRAFLRRDACAPDIVTVTAHAAEGGMTLGVRFPLSVLDAVSTATKLVEHHRDRTRVHVIVSVVAAKRIERAVDVVNIGIRNFVRITVLDSILGHAWSTSIWQDLPSSFSTGSPTPDRRCCMHSDWLSAGRDV